MNFKITKQFIGAIMLGMIMPAFLLLSNPDQSEAASDTIDIIFAAKSQVNFEKYNLNQVSRLFEIGGQETFKGKIPSDRMRALQNDPAVVYAELDSPVKVAEIIPDDSFFTTDDMNEDRQWYLEKIKMPQAWVYGTGSRDVKVAIIDTGIHASHLELNDGRIIDGFNVVEGTPISSAANSDDNGHGTAVAGVIGAITDNRQGIAGINWNVSIMPVKALDAAGSGTISSVSTAIVWAAENDADIINLSLGGPGFGSDQTLNNAIIYAYNRGSLIVSAAGNDLADQGINLDTNPVYPICADGGNNMVIGVAASDVNDQKASFSNFGINCVDITAPGKKIITTAFLPEDPADNVLIYGSGTSLATPIVSGVAALLKANNPTLTNEQMKNIVLRTADNIDAVNQKNCLGSSCNGFLGKGRINALSILSPQPLLDNVLVRENTTGLVYMIVGGKKKLVTNFVFIQRGYTESQVLLETGGQLANYPTDIPLLPLEGTLIKSPIDATVYVIHQGVRRPLLYIVFQSRNYDFADVKTIPDAELNQIPLGEWYWPPDGVMVLVKGDPTVFVMEAAVKRPVTYFVFTQRKLSFARVVTLSQDEFSHLPSAKDPFWLPPVDGTLVKSEASDTVYLIFEGTRRPLTYEAFVARNLNFNNVKTLPQAEIDVIQLGAMLLQ